MNAAYPGYRKGIVPPHALIDVKINTVTVRCMCVYIYVCVCVCLVLLFCMGCVYMCVCMGDGLFQDQHSEGSGVLLFLYFSFFPLYT
jgi:hypothetical protein